MAMEMEMLLAKNKMLLLMLSTLLEAMPPQRQGGNHLSGSISIPAEFAAVNLARIDLSAHRRRCSIGRGKAAQAIDVSRNALELELELPEQVVTVDVSHNMHHLRRRS
ncbi:uncharacterized protein LOC127773346 [Oryza glaberrima]|uniref:uncharacterized protein LOC127773346 n=1 Tax=Oryza glaberrima TaxID=4538 RepID=UPI00224C575D|nr:uncharacterized protein LOC127773346 [Oryza glaberrima]